MHTFWVNKISGTAADTQLALGLADLLQEVLRKIGKPNGQLIIHNKGDTFELSLNSELREEELINDQIIPFLEPLISPKQDERQGKKGRVLRNGFEYDKEREKQKLLSAQLKALPPALRTPDARRRHEPELEQVLSAGPRKELGHYQAINMLKVPDTFNEIVFRWQSLTVQQQWLAIGLLYRLFSQRENDVTGAIKAWEKLAKEQHIEGKALVTAVQVINPTAGKGANTSKSSRLNSGGLDSFWLLELLKFKGFMLGAAPYIIKGSKDRKTYVIAPQRVELDTLKDMMNQFRAICWSSTAIKQDVLASLRLAQVMVDHQEQEFTSRQGLEDWEPTPITSIAQGLDVAFYKDMGSAHAVMNVATINVPNWFPELKTLAQIQQAELLLEEHIRIIRRIEGPQGKESNEEIDLLRTYRDFLSGHDLRTFWQFAALYGCYLFRKREREKDVKRWLPQLTKKGLDILVMNHQHTSKSKSLSTILATPGFQNIASAIREATVRAQRRRSQENDNRYEVRYGLGQDLMRKARYREEFMAALSEFLFLYNAETAREEEKQAKKKGSRLSSEDYKNNKLRYPVTTTDVEQLGDLLDTYSPELIASMLVAYGYARLDTFKKEEAQNEVTSDDVANDTNTSEEE
ncbi:hypothetical protein KSD_52370 [Ktedonobacter sp. SOSP1-85]|uniref:hypothetical protein n=1 Tax=Ktedonobacter sp. SOSP1-85 TaxID=2778367 RepID=UPI0019162F73|nr:hypothetical protein [Ktedonobacter sp. SOSP1-85]GHO77466.1 hypothetical protein KSD_52370 [Ktedonobacter sp. SOSP1-85]